MNTIKCKLDLGKINYNGTGKRYPVDVTIELRTRGGEPTFTIQNGEKIPTGKTTPEYIEFSASGNIWNTTHTDIYCGGQCLDTIAKYTKQSDFIKVLNWWHKYHLNGMHAGAPVQESFIKDYFKDKTYSYDLAVAALKDAGLYEIEFTGKSTGRVYDHESYKYGTAWIIDDIPESDLNEIKSFIESHQ